MIWLILISIPSHATEPDKVQHAVVSSVIALGVSEATESPVLGFLASFGAGLAKEYVFDRQADMSDIGANAVGAGCGALLSFTIHL